MLGPLLDKLIRFSYVVGSPSQTQSKNTNVRRTMLYRVARPLTFILQDVYRAMCYRLARDFAA